MLGLQGSAHIADNLRKNCVYLNEFNIIPTIRIWSKKKARLNKVPKATTASTSTGGCLALFIVDCKKTRISSIKIISVTTITWTWTYDYAYISLNHPLILTIICFEIKNIQNHKSSRNWNGYWHSLPWKSSKSSLGRWFFSFFQQCSFFWLGPPTNYIIRTFYSIYITYIFSNYKLCIYFCLSLHFPFHWSQVPVF